MYLTYIKTFKEWLSERSFGYWVGVYGIVALLTFGFASVEHHNEKARLQAFKDAQCSTLEDRVATGKDCYSLDFDNDPDGMVGLFSGVFWPLYWTNKTFSVLMPGPQMPTVVTKIVIQKEYISEDAETD